MRDNIDPYIGPRFYEIGDKELFFGREYETRELCSRIIAHSVVLCYSQSGAGKTSLINAGVIPRLVEEDFDILPVARVSGQIPKKLDPNEIKNIYMFNTLVDWSSKQTQPQGLTSISMNDFLEDRKKLNDNDTPQLIIFDQFEELITHYQERWTERKTFFEQVVNSLDENSRLRVVFVMREDYIAFLDPYISLFPNKLNIRFRLERMRKEAAISAIVGPIKETNKNYADDVPEYLVDELLKVRVNTATGETITIPGEYIEPVQLQVVCQNLWSHLPKRENTITKEYVQTFGSIDNALREFYDQAVSSVVYSKKIKEQDLRIWFEKQLITLADTRSTVFRGPTKTGEVPNDIIDELQSEHIIRAEWRAGGRWYELTHDSLIKAIQDSNKLFNENLKMGAEQHYLEGLQNFDKKLYKEAIVAFDQAIDLNPDYMLSYANKSDVLNEMGEYEKALEAVNKVIQIDPNYVWAYNQRGKIYINIKEYKKALTDLNKAIKLDDEYKWAYANKSLVLTEMGEYEKALEAVSKAIQIDPGYAWVYNQRGSIYNDLKEYKKALTDLNKAIELDNKNKWVYANKSYALTEMGEYNKALEAVNKTIQIDPGYAWAYNQRGIINKDLKEYKKALTDFNEAVKIEQKFYEAYGNRGDVLLKLGKKSQAKNDFENVISNYKQQLKEDPENSSIYFSLAWHTYLNGDYKQAVEVGEKGISFNPDLIIPYFNLGLAYLSLGKDEKAIKTYKSGISKAKDLSAYEVEKKFEDAKKDIEDLITLMPKKKEIGKNIINTLNRSKKKLLVIPVN